MQSLDTQTSFLSFSLTHANSSFAILEISYPLYRAIGVLLYRKRGGFEEMHLQPHPSSVLHLLLILLINYHLEAFILPFQLPSFHLKRSISQRTNLSTMISRRIEQTENPYIEDILDRYSNIPNITNLALGSSYWAPPKECLEEIQSEIFSRDTQRYGNILGYPPLLQRLTTLLSTQGLDMTEENMAITSGANQGFMNVALTLTDASDDVIVLSPYYFSHLLSLQLCQAKVHICPFDNTTLLPEWTQLEDLIRQHKPKMVSHISDAPPFFIPLPPPSDRTHDPQQPLWLCLAGGAYQAFERSLFTSFGEHVARLRSDLL